MTENATGAARDKAKKPPGQAQTPLEKTHDRGIITETSAGRRSLVPEPVEFFSNNFPLALLRLPGNFPHRLTNHV
jgi:hypothetical protein